MACLILHSMQTIWKQKEIYRFECSVQCTRGDCRWDRNGDALGGGFRGERCCRIGDFRGVTETVCCSGWEWVTEPLGFSSCSSVANTSAILGLSLASLCRHCIARVAAVYAPFWGYWPSNLVSMIRNNFRLSPKYGFAQSTRFCSTPTFVLSTARRPDRSSSSTTPKL